MHAIAFFHGHCAAVLWLQFAMCNLLGLSLTEIKSFLPLFLLKECVTEICCEPFVEHFIIELEMPVCINGCTLSRCLPVEPCREKRYSSCRFKVLHFPIHFRRRLEMFAGVVSVTALPYMSLVLANLHMFCPVVQLPVSSFVHLNWSSWPLLDGFPSPTTWRLDCYWARFDARSSLFFEVISILGTGTASDMRCKLVCDRYIVIFVGWDWGMNSGELELRTIDESVPLVIVFMGLWMGFFISLMNIYDYDPFLYGLVSTISW